MRWALALMLWPQVAFGQSFCLALETVIAAVPNAEVVTVALPGTGSVADCTRSLELGGTRAVTCGWPFAYRDAQAVAAFERLLTDVGACGTVAGRDDARVSHPDSYDLRMFRVGEAEINVSLKDKGALSETWLFLRAAIGPQ